MDTTWVKGKNAGRIVNIFSYYSGNKKSVWVGNSVLKNILTFGSINMGGSLSCSESLISYKSFLFYSALIRFPLDVFKSWDSFK